MQVSNSTQQAADYRISNGDEGVTGRSGWNRLPVRAQTDLVPPGAGPWRVEFVVQGQTLSRVVRNASDAVLLVETGKGFDVLVERETKRKLPKSPLQIQQAQNRRLERARRALLSEFGALSPEEVASLAGGREAVERWEREGSILSVLHEGRVCYPAFQFDKNGCPRPVIAQALRILGHETSAWGIALWFLGANGYLGGKRPVDLLDTDPEAVADTVRYEALELVF